MLPLLSFSLGGAACGFDSLQKTVKLTLSFEVDEEKGEFSSQQDYKPDDNKDIKDNRELLEEAIINVRSVEVKFTQVPDQDARFAWGKVYAYPKGTTLSVNVAEDLQKPCKESEATACFESIALVSTAGTAGLSLDISPDQKVKIVDCIVTIYHQIL